jgi:FkbM family methyltransferase
MTQNGHGRFKISALRTDYRPRHEKTVRVTAMDIQQFAFVEIALPTGGTRRFFFRGSSRTDRDVIKQIFEAQHYNLSSFPLSSALKNYADLVAAEGASLLVVDAGANIGASALYFTQLDPRIHVCAVEPERGNFLVLANCTGLPITPIEAAVASEARKLWLTDPGRGEWGYRVGGPTGKFKVNAITMNDILRKFDASRYMPLICKIDIEGGEENLFRANDAWIDQFPLIIIELHDWLLPGTSNSKHFLSAISKRNFDIVYRGENMFCFNNDLMPERDRLKN